MNPTYAPESNARAKEWNARRGLPSFGTEIRTRQELYEHQREQAERSDEVLRYHEAGHAVLATALKFKRVVIDMGPDAEGRALTSYTVPGEWRAEVARKHELIVTHGGAAGEHVRFGKTGLNGLDPLARTTGKSEGF